MKKPFVFSHLFKVGLCELDTTRHCLEAVLDLYRKRGFFVKYSNWSSEDLCFIEVSKNGSDFVSIGGFYSCDLVSDLESLGFSKEDDISYD